jgi:hypothetical protein
MGRPTRDNQPDWPTIYADWLTGTMTNAALGRKHGVTTASIGRRVKTDGWTSTHGPNRNLDRTEPAEPTTPTARKAKPDVSKSLSTDQLRKRAKDLAQRLLSEIEDATTYEGEIGDIIQAEESDTVRRRAAMKAISSGERIRNLKEITAIIDAVDGKRKITKTADTAEKPQGKKAEQQAEAEKIAAGRFAPRSGPPRLVANG